MRSPYRASATIGGWRFGNTIDGCQAEYVAVQHAMANLAPVPDGLSDEQTEQAYDLFAHQRDGVLKIAITP